MKNTVSSINFKIISYVEITSWCKTYFFEFLFFLKWYPLAKCYQTIVLGLRFYAENMSLQILVVFEISHFLENLEKKNLEFFFILFLIFLVCQLE